MSDRRYEVSFRAELDDREVDALADTLWEMGYDDLCFRPLTPVRKVCFDCGDTIINRGAHAERCTGRPRKAAS